MKTISAKGIELIQSFEGCILHPYRDIAQIPTIGWGSTHYPDGTPVQMTDRPIDMAMADNLMRSDLATFQDVVNHVVRQEINQNQFDALVSFCYNVGPNNFKKSTLLRYLNTANFNDAAGEFLKWDMAGGVHSPGLKHRRELEQGLFLSKPTLSTVK